MWTDRAPSRLNAVSSCNKGRQKQRIQIDVCIFCKAESGGSTYLVKICSLCYILVCVDTSYYYYGMRYSELVAPYSYIIFVDHSCSFVPLLCECECLGWTVDSAIF